jgi:hypothetical protein
MLKSELKAGAEYAFREKRVPGTPLARIKLIQHVRGNKWKAEWITTRYRSLVPHGYASTP